VLSDQWYETRTDERKNGWYHMVWTRSSVEGKPTIHDRTEHVTSSTRVMGGTEDVFSSRTVSDLERTDDGLLLSMRSVTTISDRADVSTIRFAGDGYEWTNDVAGLTQTKRVATATPLPVDSEAFLTPYAKAGKLTTGLKLTYAAPNYQAERLDKVELAVEDEELIATPVGRVMCRRVRETVAGRPGFSVWWIDAQGVLCRMKTGTTVIDRTTKEKAKRLDPSAAAYTITIPAEPPLPRCTSSERAIIEVSIRRSADLELPDFPKTPFSREISRSANRIKVELTSHDDPAANCAFPVTDPAVAKWLENTNLYSPQDPRVKAAAREAAGSAKDARAAVRSILEYVFTSLSKSSGPIPQPTAVEILDASMGDCSEHAVLFVALCRSVGIPARRATGYAQVGDMWGAHSFCEVWLGKWVGADPTTNELGTAARYLCFGWDEDPESYPGIVSQRIQGRMAIRTTEFTEGGETVVVSSEMRTSDAAKGGRDALSGARTAPLPAGWSVEFGGWNDALTLVGPGVRADVHASWGMGDMTVAHLASQGMRQGADSTFCGVPAIRQAARRARGAVTYLVPFRRRMYFVSMRLAADAADDAAAKVEELLAPTFR
jgi:transglutaminase-like putative cysteine protease